MPIELQGEERAAFDGKAIYYRRGAAVRGRLRVTPERILFEPDKLNVLRGAMEIPQGEISAIHRTKSFGLFHTRLVIHLKDGKRHASVRVNANRSRAR